MKVFSQKLRRVKKRKLFSKSIGSVITAWTLKYGATNSNWINRVSPQVDFSQNTQPLKASYLDKNVENDTHLIKILLQARRLPRALQENINHQRFSATCF